MAYSNLRHRTERKGRSVILEREIINLQSKNPCGTPLYGRMRGSIRNLKVVEKIIHNCKTAKPPKKKLDQNPAGLNFRIPRNSGPPHLHVSGGFEDRGITQ